MKPIIGLTMGDPAGIGPEIILKAAAQTSSKHKSLCVIGDLRHLKRIQSQFHRTSDIGRLRLSPVSIVELNSGVLSTRWPGGLPVLDVGGVPSGLRLGKPSAAGGKASGEFIRVAVAAALKNRLGAIVTAPINKVSFNSGGWGRKYRGHTEMLAALTKSRRVALMLVCENLRAVHVTSHIPLKDVPRSLSKARIIETIELTNAGLKQIGIFRPSIAVCGLNPHAGDGGILGREEITLIEPAVKACASKNIHVKGPLSADTVWPKVLSGEFHAGVAMYHDQGQIPVKLMGFGFNRGAAVLRGINVTLGLPIVRTSVAHGSAFDIAGRGLASEASLLDAIGLAEKIVKCKKIMKGKK